MTQFKLIEKLGLKVEEVETPTIAGGQEIVLVSYRVDARDLERILEKAVRVIRETRSLKHPSHDVWKVDDGGFNHEFFDQRGLLIAIEPLSKAVKRSEIEDAYNAGSSKERGEVLRRILDHGVEGK